MRGEDGAGSAVSTGHSSDAFKIAAPTMGLQLPGAGDAAGACTERRVPALATDRTSALLSWVFFLWCFSWFFGFSVFNYCSRVGQRLDGIMRLKHDVEVI